MKTITPEEAIDLNAILEIPQALLSPRQVCMLTGMSPGMLREKIRQNKFPPPQRWNRRVFRWRVGEVMDWLKLPA